MGCNAECRTPRASDRPDHRPRRLRAETPAGAGSVARPRYPRVQRLGQRRPRRRRRARAAGRRSSPPSPRRLRASRRRPRRPTRPSSTTAAEARRWPAVRAVSHEDRLTLVEHLDELRTRIVVCIARLRRRPRALLLAEPPAAGNRHRAAARRPRRAAHLRCHRAVHDDADRRHLRRPDPLDADPALPGLRLRAAGLQRLASGGSSCRFCCRRADPLPGRRRLRLLRRHARRGQVPARLQRGASSTPRSAPATTSASSRRRCSPAASSSSCRWRSSPSPGSASSRSSSCARNRRYAYLASR